MSNSRNKQLVQTTLRLRVTGRPGSRIRGLQIEDPKTGTSFTATSQSDFQKKRLTAKQDHLWRMFHGVPGDTGGNLHRLMGSEKLNRIRNKEKYPMPENEISISLPGFGFLLMESKQRKSSYGQGIRVIENTRVAVYGAAEIWFHLANCHLGRWYRRTAKLEIPKKLA